LSKRTIKIHFQNGLSLESFKKEVFDIEGLSELFDFEESDYPDFLVFGPYGNDIPTKGNYIRIGYYCESIQPDMSICEWAFGVPREEEVNHPSYKRIQWHGTDPHTLIKPDNYNIEEILGHKKHFCNFLYSHTVPYREAFFKELSKYKQVDAPGRSMNNMKSIDSQYKGNIWERKRQFLDSYKFTIAFENYVYPGYQTEKLYDAMLANSIPIYCGDPFIGEIFNAESFVNANELVKTSNPTIIKWLGKISQPDFEDIRPSFYNNPTQRIKRKLKSIGRQIKMNLQFNKLDFRPVIEKIIELDQDDDKYLNMLKQPWFNNNQLPINASLKNRWIEIFSSDAN
jgi:hypothetical protein